MKAKAAQTGVPLVAQPHVRSTSSVTTHPSDCHATAGRAGNIACQYLKARPTPSPETAISVSQTDNCASSVRLMANWKRPSAMTQIFPT